jgi:hypothetical protein
VDALARELESRSDWLLNRTRAIRGVLNTVAPPYWSGIAARVFSDRLRAVMGACDLAVVRQLEAADASRRWSASMSHAQQDADAALRAAEDALKDLAVARSSMGVATTDYTALLSGFAAAACSPAGPSGADLSIARLQLDNAQHRLGEAKAKAQRAKQEYEVAENVFAQQLDATMKGAMPSATSIELGNFVSAFAAMARIDPTASTNAALMSILKRLSPGQLAALAAEDPQLLQQFWEHPPSPDAVAAWWAPLQGTPLEAALILAAPGILGNLAGLPFAVRNTCNMAVYEDALKHRNLLTPQQKTTLKKLQTALSKGDSGKYVASLVCFNLTAKVPMVAVAYGSLDAADKVTWAAPGMLSDASDAADNWSANSRTLLAKQNRLEPEASHAVVAWLGYDTPDGLSVSGSAAAQDGAWRFANELDGTHSARSAAHAANPKSVIPSVAVVAHSYGTTMAADALTHTTYDVNSFTMVGSAGLDTQLVHSLTDLHVKTGADVNNSPAIYTTAAQLDQLAPFGAATGFRAEPNPEVAQAGTRTISGALTFSSEGATTADGEVLLRTEGHNATGEGDSRDGFLWTSPPAGHGYFDPKTESLYNIAATSLGRPDLVVGVLSAIR